MESIDAIDEVHKRRMREDMRVRLSHPLEHRHTVTYGDLSTSLKVFVVLGWIVFGLYALAILIGFITGFMLG